MESNRYPGRIAARISPATNNAPALLACTNAAASVEVVQVANGATTDTEMALCVDGANFYQIVYESGRQYECDRPDSGLAQID